MLIFAEVQYRYRYSTQTKFNQGGQVRQNTYELNQGTKLQKSVAIFICPTDCVVVVGYHGNKSLKILHLLVVD
jgi:hypothetical protein